MPLEISSSMNVGRRPVGCNCWPLPTSGIVEQEQVAHFELAGDRVDARHFGDLAQAAAAVAHRA